MPFYRKKPIAIEARQYTGDNFLELQDWSEDNVVMDDYSNNVFVATLEGLMFFDEGDYVIKGARGEFYPCQKDIFKETYEEVDKRHGSIIVQPTPVKSMKLGDHFRDGGQTLQIADIEQDNDTVEITYFPTRTKNCIFSFFLTPDDTLDKIIGEEN